MVELLTQHEGDAALKQYLPQMQKEYAYWMDGVENLQAGQQEKRIVKLQDGTLLNRYWDDRDTPRPESWVEDIATAKSNPNRPATEIYRDLRSAAASGWDFSSRWMDNPQQLNTLRTTSIVPVDLNSLMFKMEKILARASKAAGDNAMANQYETLANARQKGIEKYLWNDQQGWYADYDLKSHKVRNQLTAVRPVPAVRQCGSERSRQQNGDGDENTSAATRRPEHHVGEKWTTMGCAKRLGTVAVGRDRRITKLRAKRGGDGH